MTVELRTIEEANRLAIENYSLVFYYMRLWKRSFERDRDDLRSLCDESLVRATRTWDPSRSSLAHWVGMHVKQAALNALRARARHQRMGKLNKGQMDDLLDRPEGGTFDCESAWNALVATAKLNEREAMVMRRKVIDRQTNAEIGRSIGRSYGCVDQIYQKSRAKMAKAAIALNRGDLIPVAYLKKPCNRTEAERRRQVGLQTA